MKSFHLLTTTIITATLATGAYAETPLVLPTGGQITSGAATISTDIANKTMNINQTTSKVDINWQDFSSSEGSKIRFGQKASDIAINRVTSGKVSNLRGALEAPGKVVIINDAGVVFHGTSQVNVGSLNVIAAKADPVTGGILAYNTDKSLSSTIDNKGSIHTTDGVSIFASNVKNSGSIKSDNGTVELVGADVTNTGELNGKLVALSNTRTLAVDQETLDSRAYFDTTNVKTAQVINAGGNIKADTVNLISRSNDLLAQKTINLTGVVDTKSLSVNATGDVNHSAIIKATNVDMYTTNNVNITNGYTSADTLSLTAKGNININTDQTSTSYTTHADNISLTSSADININGGIGGRYTGYYGNIIDSGRADSISLTATNNVNLMKNSDLDTSLLSVKAGRDTNLDGIISHGTSNIYAANNINASKTYLDEFQGNPAKYQAGNDINYNGTILGGNSPYNELSMDAGNNLNIGSEAKISGYASSVKLTSQNGDVKMGGNINGDLKSLNIKSGRNLQLTGDINNYTYSDAGSGTNLSSGGETLISGSINDTRGVNITSQGNINMVNAGINSNSGNGANNYRAGYIKISSNGAYNDTADTHMNTNGKNGGNITITAKNIDLNGSYNADGDRSLNTTGGSIQIKGDILHSSNTASLSAQSYNGGNIYLTSSTSNIDGNFNANGRTDEKGKGGNIAINSSTYNDAKTTKFDTNGFTGGSINITSYTPTTFSGTYSANGSVNKGKAGTIALVGGKGSHYTGSAYTLGNKGVAANNVTVYYANAKRKIKGDGVMERHIPKVYR